MKTQTVDRPARLVPFTLSFVERLDQGLYDEAIKTSKILKQSYDPKTQTSNLSIYAGTTMTYEDTTCDFLMLNKDDSRECDT